MRFTTESYNQDSDELFRSLQKMLQECDAKDSENDKIIANLQAQLDYFKIRLFGSTREIRHGSWIICCAQNYFLPMYGYLHRMLLKCRYLMADETPIQVLK